MKRGISIVAAGMVLAMANTVHAQLRPHRAEYSLRLGTAANAPRIGTAVQELTLDCNGWNIRRDVVSETDLTPSLKIKLSSRLTGSEDVSGNSFRYRAVIGQNGVEHETRGNVHRDGDLTRATIESSDRKGESVLPTSALMPLAAVGDLIRELAAGRTSFSLVSFVAEGGGEVVRFDVKVIDAASLQSTPPAERQVDEPDKRSWPVALTVTRVDAEKQKPLTSIRMQVFETGVLDRLVIDAGPVTVTAYLRGLHMLERPDCPRK